MNLVLTNSRSISERRSSSPRSYSLFKMPSLDTMPAEIRREIYKYYVEDSDVTSGSTAATFLLTRRSKRPHDAELHIGGSTSSVSVARAISEMVLSIASQQA